MLRRASNIKCHKIKEKDKRQFTYFMNQLVFSFRILKKRRGNLLKNRKQRIVAGFIALLILFFCTSISFSAAKEPVATSAPVATVTVAVTPEPEPTPSPDTKIN